MIMTKKRAPAAGTKAKGRLAVTKHTLKHKRNDVEADIAIAKHLPKKMKGKMSALESEHLFLAKAAYKTPHGMRVAGAMGYKRDPHLSIKDFAATFVHDTRKNTVLAFRGSSKLEDFRKQDAKIVANISLDSDERFKQGMDLVTKVRQARDKKNP